MIKKGVLIFFAGFIFILAAFCFSGCFLGPENTEEYGKSIGRFDLIYESDKLTDEYTIKNVFPLSDGKFLYCYGRGGKIVISSVDADKKEVKILKTLNNLSKSAYFWKIGEDEILIQLQALKDMNTSSVYVYDYKRDFIKSIDALISENINIGMHRLYNRTYLFTFTDKEGITKNFTVFDFDKEEIIKTVEVSGGEKLRVETNIKYPPSFYCLNLYNPILYTIGEDGEYKGVFNTENTEIEPVKFPFKTKDVNEFVVLDGTRALLNLKNGLIYLYEADKNTVNVITKNAKMLALEGDYIFLKKRDGFHIINIKTKKDRKLWKLGAFGKLSDFGTVVHSLSYNRVFVNRFNILFSLYEPLNRFNNTKIVNLETGEIKMYSKSLPVGIFAGIDELSKVFIFNYGGGPNLIFDKNEDKLFFAPETKYPMIMPVWAYNDVSKKILFAYTVNPSFDDSINGEFSVGASSVFKEVLEAYSFE